MPGRTEDQTSGRVRISHDEAGRQLPRGNTIYKIGGGMKTPVTSRGTVSGPQKYGKSSIITLVARYSNEEVKENKPHLYRKINIFS